MVRVHARTTTGVGDEMAGPQVVPTSRQVAASRQGLTRADAELMLAHHSTDAGERFRHAHLAAIRAAASIIELHGRPSPRTGARTVWDMLTRVAPDLGRWSYYFASGAHLRAALDAGDCDAVGDERAAELLACAEDFRDEVAMVLDPHALFAQYSLHVVAS